jgi:hypothetical protein
MSKWEETYNLDKELQQILKWLLEGDPNSSYFHKCANGRKRKMQVTMLEVDGHEVVDPTCLKTHITDYYK